MGAAPRPGTEPRRRLKNATETLNRHTQRNRKLKHLTITYLRYEIIKITCAEAVKVQRLQALLPVEHHAGIGIGADDGSLRKLPA